MSMDIEDGQDFLRSELDSFKNSFASVASKDLVNSIIHPLFKLHNEDASSPVVGIQSLLHVIRLMVFYYYVFGRHYIFTSMKALETVESGICPLTRSNGQLSARISEPLTALAGKNFFAFIKQPIETAILENIFSISSSRAANGIFFEDVLVPKVIEYLSKAPTLDQHEYFKNYTLPEWIKGAKLHTPLRDQNKIWIKAVSLVDYYENPDQCDVAVLEFSARHDCICRVISSDGSFHFMICQWKLRESVDSNDAINSTDPNSAYLTKGGDFYSAALKKRKRIEPKLALYKQGTLRVLFTFPAVIDIQNLQKKWPPKDVLVTLNKQSSRELLPENVWRFLQNVFNESM